MVPIPVALFGVHFNGHQWVHVVLLFYSHVLHYILDLVDFSNLYLLAQNDSGVSRLSL